jgi:glucose-6-phosphate dehydrogenase assembly protein OpcA
MAKAVSADALKGEDVRVNANTIEKRLADIWREEMLPEEDEKAVTRAALWNVVAHTWTAAQHAHATEVLTLASASIPQRTIVVRADPDGADAIDSWISANCHLVNGGRQVCSEEVDIVAGGERVHHVPPLVNALLLPDMPVAVWWVGDLPGEQHSYVETLLDPADRLIVDSSQFNSAADFALVRRIGEHTFTAPADLSWARIEEWRAATAALFDPPAMRPHLEAIRMMRVTSGGGGASHGDLAEALLFVAWVRSQLEYDVPYELVREGSDAGIGAVEIRFDDGSVAQVRTDRDRGVVISHTDGTERTMDCITRSLGRGLEDLIVRLLKKPEADQVYIRALRVASELAISVA